MRRNAIFVGTAGWSIPRALADTFSAEGSHLQRYSGVMSCAEINTSFYRDHSIATYEKWAAATPRGFRFSVKVPQVITHELALRRPRAPLRQFLVQIAGLGKKLGPILIQLPPSLEFKTRSARAFMEVLRDECSGAVVCEPRHASWFEPKAEAMLAAYHLGRVATDPTRLQAAKTPGGWLARAQEHADAVAYFRLHGSPRKYWSRYEPEQIRQWAGAIAELSRRMPVWSIFDNTASGAALANALEMNAVLVAGSRSQAARRSATDRT
jgi:uncharacterized protein YecE (DUF72 family)